MRPSVLKLSSLLLFAPYLSSTLSFSVTVATSPTQCGPLNVTWTGGQAPFQIMLVPVFNVPRNISIPSTSFNNEQGSYQISSLPLVKGEQFLLTMSDATGFATGGISELLTVGAPVGSASCNTSNPSLPFTFSLPSSLQQCNPYTFNEYNGSTLPITIAGLIPGGDAFLLHTPSTGSSFTWVANVAASTTIVFTLFDANGNSGGSSDTEVVALSSDTSCLNASSPSSTMTPIPSSTSGPTTPLPTHTSSSVSTGTIVGAAVGVIIAIAAIVSLAVFYLKRQRYRRSPFSFTPKRSSRRPNSVEIDPVIDSFQHPPIYPFPYQADSVTHIAPPIAGSHATPSSYRGTFLSTDPSVRASGTSRQHSRPNSNTDSSFAAFGDVPDSSMSSSSRRKAAMAGVTSYQPVTRFIVHTDAADQFSEGEADVVELPPQYSERRMHTTTSTGERPASSMTGLSSSSGRHIDEPPFHPPE